MGYVCCNVLTCVGADDKGPFIVCHPILTEQGADTSCQIADEREGLSALTERFQQIVKQ
jgi:hypothetical protein